MMAANSSRFILKSAQSLAMKERKGEIGMGGKTFVPFVRPDLS